MAISQEDMDKFVNKAYSDPKEKLPINTPITLTSFHDPPLTSFLLTGFKIMRST